MRRLRPAFGEFEHSRRSPLLNTKLENKLKMLAYVIKWFLANWVPDSGAQPLLKHWIVWRYKCFGPHNLMFSRERFYKRKRKRPLVKIHYNSHLLQQSQLWPYYQLWFVFLGKSKIQHPGYNSLLCFYLPLPWESTAKTFLQNWQFFSQLSSLPLIYTVNWFSDLFLTHSTFLVHVCCKAPV